MKLSIKEMEEVLQQEITCCLRNPDKNLTHDQQTGFVDGLLQAQYLLRAAEKRVSKQKRTKQTEQEAR